MRDSDRPLRIDQFRHVLSHKRRRVDRLVPSYGIQGHTRGDVSMYMPRYNYSVLAGI